MRVVHRGYNAGAFPSMDTTAWEVQEGFLEEEACWPGLEARSCVRLEMKKRYPNRRR